MVTARIQLLGCWARSEFPIVPEHLLLLKGFHAGPGGSKAARLTIDEDAKFQEVVKKLETSEASSATAAGKAHHHRAWTWREKHMSRTEQEILLVNLTGHLHVDEKIMQGPHGGNIEVLSEDEHVRFEEAGSKEDASEKSKTPINKF